VDVTTRIESGLAAILGSVESPSGPPLLQNALRYAVFPGGARIRPRLCLAVAAACGDDEPLVSETAAASIELLHCASLVHDDLPCFDDADLRRGRASVHKAFGERLAVLAGDGLIVLAFQALARVSERTPLRLAPLLTIIGRAVGAPAGVTAGQAWECEPRVMLADYQRAKTGALFAAAAMAGAAAAGREFAPWCELGERLGEAYQVADDIRDVAADIDELGKPVGKDAALGRPNAVAQYGLEGAIRMLDGLVAEATAAIPVCPGAAAMRALIAAEATRLMPRKLARRAA
jgi:geranylgeranyl diphosphate synthase, type II